MTVATSRSSPTPVASSRSSTTRRDDTPLHVPRRALDRAPALPRRTHHNLTRPGPTGSMTPADNQQQRMLERLRCAGQRPVAFSELGAGGIDFPAAVLSELQLSGHTIERVHEDRGSWEYACLNRNPPTHPPLVGATDGPGADDSRATARHRLLERSGRTRWRSSGPQTRSSKPVLVQAGEFSLRPIPSLEEEPAARNKPGRSSTIPRPRPALAAVAAASLPTRPSGRSSSPGG